MISSTSSANSSPIPNGWRLAKLGDVADIVGGSTPSRAVSGFWGGEIPWVVPSELTGLTGRYLKATNESVTQDGMEAAGLRLIPAKSVLLTSRATIGATAINSIPVVTNQGFQNLIPNSLSKDLWLYYAVSAQRGELERRAAGSTFKEVSRDSVRSLPILLPPLHEQRRIAEVLDSIDEAIERAESVVTSTERLRDALLHELLTKGVPGWHTEWKDAPNIGSIPACWEVAKLGDVAEVSFSSVDKKTIDGEIPVHLCNYTDVFYNRHLSAYQSYMEATATQTEIERWALKQGDVLFTKDSETPDEIGIPALVTTDMPDVICGYHLGLARPDSTIIDGAYMMRALMSESVVREFSRIANGITRFGLQLEPTHSLSIPLPPLLEQRAIAEMLDAVEIAIHHEDNKTKVLRLLKASVADALLTGRVRVRGR